MGLWYEETYADKVRLALKVRRTLHAERSELQHIEIVETEAMGRTLLLDGVFMTSERDEHYYHEMLVHPALTTAQCPRRVLIIGGGDGGTAREVLRHPEVEHVDMIEIDGRVVEACKEHLPGFGAWDDPRLFVSYRDGIAYVRETDAEPYDVVLLDGTDPVGPGKGLFDEAFYRNVYRVLAPGGVFALQSESPFLMRDIFLEIRDTLGRIFSRVHPYFGPAPIYGAGVWSWTFASDTVDPLALDPTRAERMEAATKYYNADIHRGAFALPNDLR
jgi:spermidine synthase